MNELQVNLRCPYCKQSLMCDDQIIDGYPSIKVVIQNSNTRRMLYLSSIYGSYNIISEFNIPMDEILLFFCPDCQSSLLIKDLCDKCSAPMTFFELLQGGKVQIC